MTSTLWFWIVLIVAILIVIWIVKKFIWRIIIILICLFVLFFIIKWIFPSAADSILTWAKTVPVKATNWLNTAVLNKDIVLPLEKTDISDEKDSDKIEKTDLDNIEVVDIDKKEEKKWSWFSRLFKKKNKVEEEIDIEVEKENVDVEVEKHEEEVVDLWKSIKKEEVEVDSWSKKKNNTWDHRIIQTWTILTPLEETMSEVVATWLNADDEVVYYIQSNPQEISWEVEEVNEDWEKVYYIPSNPQPVKKATETVNKWTSSNKTAQKASWWAWWLSASDLAEANAIFGN